MNVAFTQRVFNVCTVYLQRCFIVTWLVSVKLLPSRRTFSVHHTTMHQFTVIRSHIGRVLVCLAVTSRMHFWQIDQIFYVSVLFDVTWLVSRETAAISVYVLYTPYNHAPTYSVIRSHMRWEGVRVRSCNLPHAPFAD